jgi:hypothetical protein
MLQSPIGSVGKDLVYGPPDLMTFAPRLRQILDVAVLSRPDLGIA